jgi:hypothetical protein
MTISAVDAQLANVVRVTERHGLRWNLIDSGGIARAVKRCPGDTRACRNDGKANDEEAADGIESFWENLRHRDHLMRTVEQKVLARAKPATTKEPGSEVPLQIT